MIIYQVDTYNNILKWHVWFCWRLCVIIHHKEGLSCREWGIWNIWNVGSCLYTHYSGPRSFLSVTNPFMINGAINLHISFHARRAMNDVVGSTFSNRKIYHSFFSRSSICSFFLFLAMSHEIINRSVNCRHSSAIDPAISQWARRWCVTWRFRLIEAVG